MQASASKRVVITGIGLVSPLGNTRESTWSHLIAGESGARKTQAFQADSWPVRLSCEVKDFQINEDAFEENDDIFLHRASGFGVNASHEAISDAGIVPESIQMGANVGPITPDQLKTRLIDNLAKCRFIKNHPANLAHLIARRWKIKGEVSTIQSACASSGQSVGQAYRSILNGEYKSVLSGGADSLASELMLGGFVLLGALSKNDSLDASKPFDKSRDGFVAGEGAAMLVLEEREQAINRGANIYAELSGYAETMSAFRITDLPPGGRGIREAMSQLYTKKVDYINAHGTSTELNDRVEAESIEEVFKGQLPLVSSTKSATGHLISAAGALEAAFCSLAIRDQVVPPTLHLQESNVSDNINFVANRAEKSSLNYVLSNSIGFGGTNTSISFARFE